MVGVLKVSLTGVLPNNEVWSVNPVWALTTGDFPLTYSDLNTIATAINAVTVPSAMRAFWISTTQLTGCKLEHRALDGELLSQIEQSRPAPAAGSSSTPLPLQVSIVSSLRTTNSSGNGRGRLYWPATGGILAGTTLRFDSTQVGGFIGGVKTYLSGIETAIDATSADPYLAVWSRSVNTAFPVNRLLAGDVPDVQRRRRDKAIETYTQTAWP
jgi:hypothetical protein